MIDTLICNESPGETRVALLDNGRAVSVIHHRDAAADNLGNIFLGRILRIEPSLDAAFIDIGLERAGFLKARYATPWTDEASLPIARIVQEGQELVVQISRQPSRGKGALLTARVSLPGRFLVLSPGSDGVKVSRRIDDARERARLEGLLAGGTQGGHGLVVRTAALNADEDALKQELAYLGRTWEQICELREAASPPAFIHGNSDPLEPALRDHLDVHTVVSDSPRQISRLRHFDAPFFSPEAVRLELYQGNEPIFEHFGVEEVLDEALGAKVPLPSGGSLFIEIGEALTAIDVNAGRFQRGESPEQTALIANLEAARESLSQIRLRDIAGLIVIDFVNMREKSNRHQLMTAMRSAASRDPNVVKILDLSELGLVELVRRRARRPLGETILEDCPHCGGSGQRKSKESVAIEIMRDVLRNARHPGAGQINVYAASEVIGALNDLTNGAAMAEEIGRSLEFHVRDDFDHDEFEIVVDDAPTGQ